MTSERPCRRTDTRIWRRYDGGGGGKDETIRTRHDPDRQQVEVLSGGELEGVDIDRIRVTTARGLLAVVVLVPKEVPEKRKKRKKKSGVAPGCKLQSACGAHGH